MVVVITVALVILRRQWPAGLAAWTYSAIVLLPISGVVHSGNQLAADRYSYLSGFGFALLPGARSRGRETRPARAVRRALPATACLVPVVVVARRWLDADDDLAKFGDALDESAPVDPACSICESNLGRVIARPGRFEEAEAHVRRAIELTPHRSGPHENMGALMVAGTFPRRRRSTVESAPTFARHGGPEQPGGRPRVPGPGRGGGDGVQRGRAPSPRMVDAAANLGVLYVCQGRYAEAIGALRQALALDPEQAAIKAGLARALRRRGDTARARGADRRGPGPLAGGGTARPG